MYCCDLLAPLANWESSNLAFLKYILYGIIINHESINNYTVLYGELSFYITVYFELEAMSLVCIIGLGPEFN